MITEVRHVSQRGVSSRACARSEEIMVWRANVEILTPDGAGGSSVRYVTCQHMHTFSAAAEACARGLARRERAKEHKES